MDPGDDGDAANGDGPTEDPRDTADLAAGTAPVTADSTPLIRPAVTDATMQTLPTIAASPRLFAPTEAPPARSRGRTAVLALVVLVAVLLGGALVGRLTAPPTPVVAAPSSSGPGGLTVTAPPFAPPPASVPTVPARPADALAPWAGRVSAAVDVPAVAVQAYAYAQLVLQGTRPDCHLGWTTLAGIGEVVSHHGQVGGAVLDRGGRSTPPIVGPPLDGRDGRALVADTDAGAFDADPTYDRAMGPMLLLPSIWRAYASDGDDDQIQDPYDIDDASVAVARLLCSGSEDLSQLSGWTASVARLQQGEEFARAVFQAADSYGQRSRDIE